MTHHRHATHPRRSGPRIELHGLLDQLFPMGDGSSMATAAWAPRVDIRETPDAFVIAADVPGVAADALDIQMDKGVLTLKGERARPEEREGETVSRTERHYGAFHRRFALPDTADAEAIEATHRDGVLEIRIPKKPEVQPRRIAVNA